MKSLFLSSVFLKITSLLGVFLVIIGIIEYIAYPDLKNMARFLDALTMLFLPYLLSKHFEILFSKNKLAIFSFFLGIYFVSSCIFYTSQIVLHHVVDQERKVQMAKTVKERYTEGYEKIQKRIAERNGGKIDSKNTANAVYNEAINHYSIGTLATKPFRNLLYYLIFSVLSTLAVIKFNQNYDE